MMIGKANLSLYNDKERKQVGPWALDWICYDIGNNHILCHKSMEFMIKAGCLVRKRSNGYAKYLVLSVTRDKAQLEPLDRTLSYPEHMLHPLGYPVKKLEKVPYNNLLVSCDNMTRIINYSSLQMEGTIYVSIDNKQAQKIDLNIETCNIVKAYTSKKGSGYKFIAIDELKHVITPIKTKEGIKRLPSIRVRFHGL